MMNVFLAALLAAIWFATDVDSVAVGDEICIEGYVMDVFCIERGSLLDNPRVRTLEGPEEHTVHCLADVPICYNSGFEILLDPSEGETLYTRGWRLDESGTELVLDLARTEGSCSTCSGGSIRKGFRAALNVTVLDLGSDESPPFVSVQAAAVASPDEKVCGDTEVDLSTTERPGSSENRARRMLLSAVGMLAGEN